MRFEAKGKKCWSVRERTTVFEFRKDGLGEVVKRVRELIKVYKFNRTAEEENNVEESER